MKKVLCMTMLFFLAAGCKTSSPASYVYRQKLSVADKILLVEVVDTEAKREKGLSGRDAVGENHGMIFIFNGSGADKSARYNSVPAFWMKDMKFNLDIIWINKNKIIGITADVPSQIKDERLKIKDSELPTYSPPSSIDMVLEVNAGWSLKNGVKVGDEVKVIEQD